LAWAWCSSPLLWLFFENPRALMSAEVLMQIIAGEHF